jgi:hypothetical protein
MGAVIEMNVKMLWEQKSKRDKLIVMTNKVNAINKAVYELSNRNKSNLGNIIINVFYRSGRLRELFMMCRKLNEFN